MIHFTRYLLTVILLIASHMLYAQGLYAGLKLGVVDVDESAFDNAYNGGILLGYDVYSDQTLTWGVEAELTTTLSDGDFEVFGMDGDWDINTQALYGVLKFGGAAVYGKLKAGVLREDVSARAGGISADDTDTGGSWGAGAGWRFMPKMAFEFEYTQIEEDAAFWSIGVNYSF